MTSASGEFSRGQRVREWCGHYPWAGDILLAGSGSVADLAPGAWGLAWLPLTVAAGVILTLSIHHDFHLCWRCIAGAPDNPAQEVADRRDRLRLHHRVTERPFLALAVLFAWLAVTVALSDVLPVHVWWVSITFRVVLWSPIVCWSRLTVSHQRLRPWCPFCKPWEDGGTAEKSPTPGPVGTKVRT